MSSEPINDYEDDEVYPSVANGPIAPALEADDTGWSKSDTWVMQAETSGACGDYAVGPLYEARYVKTVGEQSMVVTERYYVEPQRFTRPDGTMSKHYDVTGMYEFTLCADPDDPGMSEISTTYEYDSELHEAFLWEYEDARKLAERFARRDTRGTLLWKPT